MRNMPPNGRFAEPSAIPANRSETEALPPALRDLADLLADIVARRLQDRSCETPERNGDTG